MADNIKDIDVIFPQSRCEQRGEGDHAFWVIKVPQDFPPVQALEPAGKTAYERKDGTEGMKNVYVESERGQVDISGYRATANYLNDSVSMRGFKYLYGNPEGAMKFEKSAQDEDGKWIVADTIYVSFNDLHDASYMQRKEFIAARRANPTKVQEQDKAQQVAAKPTQTQARVQAQAPVAQTAPAKTHSAR